MRIAEIGLLLIIAALIGYGIHLKDRPEEWQYTLISPPDENLQTELDKAGALGWEIVFARRATAGEGSAAKASYEMILKRRGVAPLSFSGK